MVAPSQMGTADELSYPEDGETHVHELRGDEREPGGRHHMNVWQGQFPNHDTGADGFVGPAPVDSFEPNGYGLHNTCGNVWEWCADWFAADYYLDSPPDDPPGPDTGRQRVMRGGSYLCHHSYCHRYRVGARSSSGPDSSAGNLGFRTVAGLAENGPPDQRAHRISVG